MAENELRLAGISISKDVVAQIIKKAAAAVEGVASVGGNDIASNLISVITSRSVAPDTAVETGVENDKLYASVHLAVFYGYPLTKLASDVREAIAKAAISQIGVEVSSVDVSIDSLVFPKE